MKGSAVHGTAKNFPSYYKLEEFYMYLQSVNTFIKDAVINCVLDDLGITLQDLGKLDEHASDLFNYLCACKEADIRGVPV